MEKVCNFILPSIRAIAIIAVFFLYSTNAIAQEKRPLFTIVENMPSYKGCESLIYEEAKRNCTDEKIIEFLIENIIYPEEAKAKGMEGKVFVSYIVEEDGSISNVEVLRGITDAEVLDKEAVRVIENLPNFNPGLQRGKPVAVKYTIPINFTMDNRNESGQEE